MRVVENSFVPIMRPVLQMHPDCDTQNLWCTPEFRASIDKRLLDLFGSVRVVYFFGNTVVTHPANAREVRQAIAMADLQNRIDDSVVNAFYGR